MSPDDPQLELLLEQTERYINTFRWLWLTNLIAAVMGVFTRHYDVVFVAGLSAVISLIGVGFARKGMKSVVKALIHCRMIRSKMEA